MQKLGDAEMKLCHFFVDSHMWKDERQRKKMFNQRIREQNHIYTAWALFRIQSVDRDSRVYTEVYALKSYLLKL